MDWKRMKRIRKLDLALQRNARRAVGNVAKRGDAESGKSIVTGDSDLNNFVYLHTYSLNDSSQSQKRGLALGKEGQGWGGSSHDSSQSQNYMLMGKDRRRS